MKKTCKNCQYHRAAGFVTYAPESKWCSNSQSENALQPMSDADSCGAFEKRGKKAGIGLRALNWILQRV